MGVSNGGGSSNPDFTGKTLIADKLTLLSATVDCLQIPNGASIQDQPSGGANFRITFDHNGPRPINTVAIFHNGAAGNEAAGATAGAGAAPPATVQGYFVVQDNAGVIRKIPYYAN